MPKDDWEKYQKLVMSELERCAAGQKRTDDAIQQLTIAVTKLKIKIGILGTIAVALTTLVNFIVTRS